MSVRILTGDCRETLKQLPDESVHCVVTSPPYWGLRAYNGGPEMIGLEPTFEEHQENLVAVFREVRRVLRQDGTCWINYGDAYTSGNRATYRSGASDNKGHQVQDDQPRPKTPDGLKPKDLMFMPARVAMALQTCGAADAKAMQVIDRVRYELIDAYRDSGAAIPDSVLAVLGRLNEEYSEAKGDSWWVRSEVVWHKSNPMPESCQDRPTSAHEKIFLLSKSGSSIFWTHRDQNGVRAKPKPDYVWRNRDTGDETDVGPKGWRVLLSERDPKQKRWRRVNLWDGHDYFYDADAVRVAGSPNTHARRKDGERVPSKGTEATDNRTGSWKEKRTIEEQAAIGSNVRNVWKIPTFSFSSAHFATFPPKLVEPCIKAGTSEKGVCNGCGAPWVREVERVDKGYDGSRYGERAVAASTSSGGTARSTLGSSQGRLTAGRKTVGWSPTCDCGRPPRPAVVLDPFSGAGTVGLVAQRLGRDAVLIEISSEYAEMSRERINGDMPLFADVKVE